MNRFIASEDDEIAELLAQTLDAFDPRQPRDNIGRWTGSSASDDSARAIAQYLDFTSSQSTVSRFVQEHGRAYVVDEHTYDGHRDEMRMCYMNAGRTAFNHDDRTYVEGFVTMHGIPLQHAWTVDANGRVYDSTIRSSDGIGRTYFGVPFRTDYVRRTALRTKVWGILSHTNMALFSKNDVKGIVLGDEFKEELHPRDKEGQFTEKGTGVTQLQANALAHTLKVHPLGLQVYQIETQVLPGKGYEVSVRYFGEWKNDHGDYDEDSDQQVPTPKTVAAVDKLAADFAEKHGVNVTHSYGEKNWITFTLNPKTPESTTSVVGSQPLDMDDLTKVSGALGSNPGGIYEDHGGNRYYVKSMDEAHAKNELLAARLYALAGSKTLEYVDVKPKGDTHFVATKYEKLFKTNVNEFTPEERARAQAEFGVHAWLANWDAAGTGGDNSGVRLNPVTTASEAVTKDVGGALAYRAQGTPKGAAFGDKVTETDTMRSYNTNPDAAKLFGSMSNGQLQSAYAKVTKLSNDDITKTVVSVYPMSAPPGFFIANRLINRRDDLSAQFEKLNFSAPIEMTTAPNPDHPSKEYLNSVKGTTAERVALRKQIKASTSSTDQKQLKLMVIASFWKQHTNSYLALKKENLAKKIGQYSKSYKVVNPLTTIVAESTAKAAQAYGVPNPLQTMQAKLAKTGTATPAELEKAKKNAPLQLKYVPGAPDVPAAHALVMKFNDKYSGVTLSTPEALQAKVQAFKDLQTAMIPLMSAQQQQAAKAAAEAAKGAAAAQAKAAQAQAAKAAALAAAKKKPLELDHMSDEERRVFLLNKVTGNSASSYMTTNSYASSHGLTPSETGMIRAYTGSHYSKLNAHLRDGIMNEEEWHFKHDLNDALEKLPPYGSGKEVYRKISVHGPEYDKLKSDYTPGKLVQWNAFSSTSKNSGTWSGNVRFTIHQETGRDVQKISSHGSSEAEVIIPAGRVFKVIGNTGSEIELIEIKPKQQKYIV